MYVLSVVVQTIDTTGKNIDGTEIEKAVNYIYTPNVVEKAREHFACDSLFGAEVKPYLLDCC
jgi:hypothetical protein